MKSILYIIICTCSNMAAAGSPRADTSRDLRSDIFRNIVQWLKPGTYVPTVRGEFNTRMRFVELGGRIDKAYREDQNWFRDSTNNLYGSDSARFFSKIGMSREEYNEYKFLFNLPLSYSKDTLRIFRKGHFIFFKGSGKLAALDAIRFNIALNTVQYKQYTLRYAGKKWGQEKQDSTPGPLRFYYNYEYVEKKDTGEVTAKNMLDMFTIKSFWLHVGQQVDSKKTVINFSDYQMEQINLKAYIELDLIF